MLATPERPLCELLVRVGGRSGVVSIDSRISRVYDAGWGQKVEPEPSGTSSTTAIELQGAVESPSPQLRLLETSPYPSPPLPPCTRRLRLWVCSYASIYVFVRAER